MRHLTIDETRQFANRPEVRRVAVENFLMSMGESEFNARGNLRLDTRLYSWNDRTVKAIQDGINLAAELTDKQKAEEAQTRG